VLRMFILSWVLLELLAGFLANQLVHRRGDGRFFPVVVGIAGAVAGGSLFTFFGAGRVTGLNAYSVLAASAGAMLAGALLVLVTFQSLRRLATLPREGLL
jgi:uncharacterized membrane protein YeaQ/YmgE (transglycosylase-associated protein family)